MAGQKNLNKYRHKWENCMVMFAILVAIAAIIAVVVFAVSGTDIPSIVILIVGGLFSVPIITPIFLHYTYWKEIVDAVEVNDKQYPELYQIFKEQVQKGEFGFMPRLYVKNGNGVLNAFAAKSGLNTKTHSYVVVYSDLVDAFYDLGNEDTIRFVVSHELGHIKLGHINVRRGVLKGVLRPLFLSDTLVRAQEYSADRFGASITNSIAMPSLAVLASGKRNYERLNIDEYINNDTRQISWFWVAIVNFRANHAVLRRRLAAARRMDQEGWENVHGEML